MTYSKFRSNNKQKGGTVEKKRRVKSKLKITFDLESRKEYLTGFQKRKQQKKAKYRCMLERKVAAEKQRIKEKMLNSTTKTSSSDFVLPEVEELLKNDTAELELDDVKEFNVGSKTVVISSLNHSVKPTPDSVDEELEMDEEGAEEGEEHKPSVTAAILDRKMQSKLKKSANQMLQSSKFFKANQRLKTKKNKRKMLQRNRQHVGGKAEANKSKSKSKEISTAPTKARKGGKRPKNKR